MKRYLLSVLLCAVLVACGGSSSVKEVSPSAVATPTVQSDVTATRTPTNTPTPPPTPTTVPKPTPIPRPTPTPAPTPTPVPIDLTGYLPIETDVFGDFTITGEMEVEASSFASAEGFVQGRSRTLSKQDPQIEIDATCAEYASEDQAQQALSKQHDIMMSSTTPFILTADDGAAIKIAHAYLAGGTGTPGGIDRPIAVVWFQTSRVMCFDVILGVPGGQGAPRGGAIDAANHVLARLAEASAPTPTPIPGGPNVFGVGETVRFNDGFSVTVKSIEDPVVGNGEAISPQASIVLVAIEVEVCAGPSTTDALISPLDFAITLDDNTRADRSYSLVKQPELDTATLYPGECLHGWVTFERNWKPRPVYIVIDLFGYQAIRVKAR